MKIFGVSLLTFFIILLIGALIQSKYPNNIVSANTVNKL